MRHHMWLGLALTSCTSGGDGSAEFGPYDVTVRWTDYGIPHVVADDRGSLAYGMGYAFARDHLCVLADQIVTVHGHRARWLGPGEGEAHIESDFGWKALDLRATAVEQWPLLGEDVRVVIAGYVAGYNRYLSDEGAPEPCAGQPWVKPLESLDLLTHILALGLDGSGAVLSSLLGTAQPPSGQSPPPWSALKLPQPGDQGSNGWAIGASRSASGGGMLLSNTHFPGEGVKQWHESHLTIPGELDVYGVSLMGVPVINMGFNEHVAWTHTVSFAPRFTIYTLELDPEDPTRYRYGDTYREMTSKTHEVEVLGSDGVVTTRTRTLYRSHYGPMLDAPVVGWNPVTAVTYRDVNADNFDLFEVWDGMARAESREDFVAVHEATQAIPWVYTMMATREGEAVFLESSRTPYVDDALHARWQASAESDFLVRTFADLGVIVLDGSDPTQEWREDEAAAAAGIVPFEVSPQMVRDDYVFNANDGYWLAHGEVTLDDYPAVYGGREIFLPRTRTNARYLSDVGPDAPSGADGKFDLTELEAAIFSGRSVIADKLRAPVVERCDGASPVELDDATVDVTEACRVLAAWDGTYALDAVGAVLWRETLGGGRFDVNGLVDAGELFAVPFDEDDPVETPNTLTPAPLDGPDPILLALAEAVQRLEGLGLAVDVPLGEVQAQQRGTERFAVPGGLEWEAPIAISGWRGGGTPGLPSTKVRGEVVNEITGLTTEGYPVSDGNSWMMAMSFEEDGPRARAVMAYSQSEDPSSPHFDDQSALYAAGEMRDILYREEDILAAAELEEVQLREE